MTGKRKLSRSFVEFSDTKVDKTNQYSGTLGINNNVVEVPNRDGYVYVRLRDNLNEVIQAYNDKVLPVYDLPVLVEFTGGEYRVLGRDLDRYAAIGWQTNSSYLPRHGNLHSRSPTGGGDIVWVYGNQFMPLLAVPSGSSGGGGIILYDYSYYYGNEWKYFPVTGVTDLLGGKPTGANSASLALVYLDASTNDYGVVWADSEILVSITGTASIVPLLPDLDESYYIPIVGIRLVTGTSRISWNNMYDVRPFYSTYPTGTSGGGGADFTGFTDGSVIFVESEAAQEDNDHFFWDDDTNTMLLGNNDISRVISSAITDLAVHKENYSSQELFSVGTAYYPIFAVGKARGTYASKSAVQSGDILFRQSIAGWDGTGWQNKARVDVFATENWSTAARGTKWQFRTTAISGTDSRSIFEILGGSVDIMKALQFDNIQSVSTEYIATTEDCVIDFAVDNVGNDLYLPSASGNKQILFIHMTGDPEDIGLTIYAQVGETVNGERPFTIYGAEQSITLIADGTDNWISVAGVSNVQSHIDDADGSLADATRAINEILVALENLGFVAIS